MATHKDPEKTVDLPPEGSRNADPITDTPGSHPIETGVGAAIGGAASGIAVGAVGGPVGAIIGAIAGGALAGGLAGKGIGELIDPTTEDNWIREYFGTETNRPADATPETYRSAYRYGVTSATRHAGKRFEDVESDLERDWDAHRGASDLSWDQARGAVRDGFDRTARFHGERASVTVPVDRQEVVVDRKPRME